MLRIYTTPIALPEKEYVFRVLFSELLQIPFTIFASDNPGYRVELPNGASLLIEDHYFQKWPENWIQVAAIPARVIPLKHPNSEFEGLLCLYGRDRYIESAGKVECGGDLIASTFFMLSRWEEYILPDRDEHGRFPAKSALSVQLDFLQRPIVNEYADALRNMLARLGYPMPESKRHFEISLTHDVDHPRLWWTPFSRLKTCLGAAFKRKSARELKYWLSYPWFSKQDPFDVFEEWFALFEQHNRVAQFNFMGERPSSSDCYYPLKHPFVLRLIQKIAERGHKIGFHPSYEAFDDEHAFQRELRSLRAVSPIEINSGRQHYLRFSVPQTWQRWEAEDLSWDSSLGYSERNGFRCGICCPFPVFDILSRKTLNLYEKPLIAMDITSALYEGLSPEDAYDELVTLKKKVAKHQGEFVLLWHNSSWNGSDWEPWKEVYRAIIS